MICDTAEKAAVLLENVQRGETPGLKTIILMDAFDPPLLDEAQKSGVLVRSLRDVEVRPSRPFRFVFKIRQNKAYKCDHYMSAWC